MKKSYAMLLMLMWTLNVKGQKERSTEMTIPEYPALSIIGSQTSEITKPGDYTALLATVVSPMVSNNGTIPANLALEFNPYYFDADRRTLDEYLNRDAWSSIKRTSKISIGSNTLLGSDSITYARVGLGYRTFICDGTLTNLYTEKITNADLIGSLTFLKDKILRNWKRDSLYNIDDAEAQSLMSVLKLDTESKLAKDMITMLQSDRLSIEEKAVKIEQIRDAYADDEASWVRKDVYNRFIRSGFFWEFAAAVSIDFAQQKIDKGELQRFGVWSIFTWRPKKAEVFDASALVRYSNYSLDPTVVFNQSGSFGDLGVNLKWKPAKWLTLSGEYILRYGFNDHQIKNGENMRVNVASGAQESKLSLIGVIHVTDKVSTTFTYSNINGEQSYNTENLSSLLIGFTAAILPVK
ncbi:MAG: hypothetical protein N4A46_16875 [Schleiferiaceae bacterium]|jgi:hypothetical protein|nr:hypothetical protein [Schleiferiaceae bacterium]